MEQAFMNGFVDELEKIAKFLPSPGKELAARIRGLKAAYGKVARGKFRGAKKVEEVAKKFQPPKALEAIPERAGLRVMKALGREPKV